MKNFFYVTTPIYYVNAKPHIGHAYTTILADFMKRLYTLLGYDSFMLTGTDEHGDKIAQAAHANKTTPKDYADQISGLFKKTWDDMHISYNDFIRTTDKRHIDVVQSILQKVYETGDIYFGSYGGYYCVGCERFLTEKEIIDGKCPEHNRTPDFIEEKNYFFKMSKYQSWLIEYINANPDFIRPERYKNEVLAMLKGDALEDLCISRPKTRLEWGIELPFDKNYVTYVWFDALINYISAIGYPEDEKFKKFWPMSQHIIAKDIVKPHGIFWPTMLHAAGIAPYHNLNVHGYWNMDDAKMSKSLGNVVTPGDLMTKFGNDQMRYFFLREMTFGHDAKFNEDVVVDRVNYDLANDLGNLVKRSFNMVDKYFEGKIPEFKTNEPCDREILQAKFKSAFEEYKDYCCKFQTSIGIEKFWEFIRHMNKYVDEYKPWHMTDKDKLSSVMRNLLEALYSISVVLSPVLIDTTEKIIKGLCAASANDLDALAVFDNLKTNDKISDIGVLFPKIEKKKEAKVENKTEAKPQKEAPKAEVIDDGLVDIKDFAKVDIRVAKVLQAEKVEGSDKLLKLELDSGLDTRTIVAGIAKFYTPEYMTGKKILLVANLKPATIFKIKSNGMLLAAKTQGSDKITVIEVNDEITVGARLG